MATSVNCMVQEKQADVEYVLEGDRVDQTHLAFMSIGTNILELDRIVVDSEYFRVLAISTLSTHLEVKLSRRT